jgi:hypothetical protein
VVAPFETFFVAWDKWSLDVIKLYKLNHYVILRFLNKIGFNIAAEHFVEDILKPLEEEYVEYVLKHTPDKKANNDEKGDDQQTLLA